MATTTLRRRRRRRSQWKRAPGSARAPARPAVVRACTRNAPEQPLLRRRLQDSRAPEALQPESSARRCRGRSRNKRRLDLPGKPRLVDRHYFAASCQRRRRRRRRRHQPAHTHAAGGHTVGEAEAAPRRVGKQRRTAVQELPKALRPAAEVSRQELSSAPAAAAAAAATDDGTVPQQHVHVHEGAAKVGVSVETGAGHHASEARSARVHGKSRSRRR